MRYAFVPNVPSCAKFLSSALQIFSDACFSSVYCFFKIGAISESCFRAFESKTVRIKQLLLLPAVRRVNIVASFRFCVGFISGPKTNRVSENGKG